MTAWLAVMAVCPAWAQPAQMYDDRPRIGINGEDVVTGVLQAGEARNPHGLTLLLQTRAWIRTAWGAGLRLLLACVLSP